MQHDKTTQKKCYKILDMLLESGKPSKADRNDCVCKYISEKFEGIMRSFTSSLNECTVAAKVPRLKCLNALMAYISEPTHKTLLKHILPEVILSIREVNQKSREASFILLNTMMRLWVKLSSDEDTSTNESGYYFFLQISLISRTRGKQYE